MTKQFASNLSKKITTYTNPLILTTGLLIASLSPALVSTGVAHAIQDNTRLDAFGTLELAGSGWLNGGGVDSYSNGSSSGDHSPITNNSVNGVTSGEEWQCVEMVNRLYLTKAWTTTTWVGNGNTLINDVHNHSGLIEQDDDHISYLNPGDVITLDDGGSGHEAIINTVGSTIQIVNQNGIPTYSSASLHSGTSFSAKNADIDMSGWAAYSVQAIVHHPSGSTDSAAIVPQSISYSGNLNLFTTGGDGQVYTQYWNGSSWSGYASIGGSMVSNPALIVKGSGLDVFARDVDNQVYTKYWNGSSWSGWSSLGSTTMQGNPTVIHNGSTEVDVFALGTDGHPYVVQYNNDMYVFGRAKGDNTIWKKYWSYSGQNWNGWSQLGTTTMAGDPSAYQYGSSELDTFVTGSDTKTYKDTYNGSSWGGFSSM